MKKTLLIMLALLVAGILPAQKAPTVKLISSSEKSIVVNVQLNGYSTTKVQTSEGDQFIVNVPEMAGMLEAGCPDLPTLPVPALIGDRAEMSVSVIDAQFADYPGISIAPSKGLISRQINPDDVPYTYGEMYQQNAFWPAAQAYLEAPYILRDFRGQNIMVRPFAYNPATHTLRVYESLTIEMKKVSDNGENQKAARKSNIVKTSPEFKASYDRRYINFGASAAKYPFIEDAGEMLVICADQFMEGMQPFVDWKNESGRPTTMVSVTEVGGNNTDVIKNYITNYYNDAEHNLTYVLLVGDYAHITPHPFSYNDGTSSTQYSDIWFGQIEGNDNYPEVFVGRFSVESDAHVATHVNKVLYYERDMPEGVNWCNQGLGIGSTLEGSGGHFGEYDAVHIDFIRDTLLHYTYNTVTDLHQGGSGSSAASAASISNVVNQGVSIINYCNHGSETSWGVASYSNSNVNALTNDNMWPIVWSVACLNGKFGYYSDCFAETWMRATDNSTGVPTGAIGGMFSWLSQPWQPPMFGQDEMNNILTEWRNSDLYNHTLAGASLNGNMDVIDKGGSSGAPTHNGWILFGDPSLLVRTDTPEDMDVSFSPSVLLLGMTELQVNAATEYGIATLSQNGEVISSARVENGTATLIFPGLDNVGTATLTVIGFNKVTYRSEIEIVPADGPYLVMSSYEIVSNEGAVNFGEETTVNIGIKNVGIESIDDVTITLSTTSEYVTDFPNNTSVISNIDPDQIVNIENEFRFVVANNVPDGTKIPFVLELNARDHSWQAGFVVTVNAPQLEMANAYIFGDTEAGGSGYLMLCFENKGHATAPVESFNIFSCSPDVVLEAVSYEVAAVNANDSVCISIPFTIAEGVETGSCYELSYLLNAEHYSIPGYYIMNIGQLVEGFETGDFSAYNWSFEGNQQWTIDSTSPYSGSFCAKSGTINHSQTSAMKLSIDIPADGEISFYRKVSSENNYDKLFFKIDGEEMGDWSGNVNWGMEVFPISAGRHVLLWEYNKDYSASSGSDCAWVDQIVLPAINLQNCIEPLAELIATVEENQVTLEWAPVDRAVSYTVFRNGEQISTQEEAGFTESVEHGVYTYSVVITDEDGHKSKPVFTTVNVISFMSAEESMVQHERVFPNPTEGVLNIEANGQYHYILFNSYGQQVMAGEGEGHQQLRLDRLAKGVYLLRIDNGLQNNVHKVIVK